MGCHRLFLIALASLAASACISREIAEVPPNQDKEQFHQIPLSQNRDVDILFVVDNSVSMEREQQSLQTNFYRFIDKLESIEGGLPNVHIAVISTDLGDGGHGCNTNDNGRFQSSARTGCTVSPPAGSFIVDVEQGDDRARNFPDDQSLADTFACIARLGTTGCGFEQPLESMRRALNGSNPGNAGFLREDAYLAIIFITDEDDCSAENTDIFRVATDDDPLGPRHSFRCWEHGVQCEPDDPRTLGAKENCIPRPDSQFMYEVDEFINFVHELKDDPNKIIVAGIMGKSSPVVIQHDMNGDLDLKKSCPDMPMDRHDGAVPATRMEAFLAGFRYNRQTSLCDSDLSGALQTVADLLAAVLGTPCLVGALIDTDASTPGVQPNCQVSEVTHPRADDQIEKVMPACDTPANPEASTNKPCYVIRPADQCSEYDTGLGVEVFRTEDNVPPDTVLWVRCEGA